MRFKDVCNHIGDRLGLRRLRGIPVSIRLGLVLTGWLVLVTALHYYLNTDHEQRPVVKMGYMPVITNLAAPILDHVSKNNGDIRFQAIKFASFAEMAEALRNDQIQAAFMIAPLAVVLQQQGADVQVVYIGNRHESTLVTRSDLKVARFEDLAGRTIAVPMRFSGHCLGIRRLMEKYGLEDQINLVEMNPPDMAAALAVGALDGYFVGEPFAAQAVKKGDARVLYYVEDIWKHFICNLVLIKRGLADTEPGTVQHLVQGAARSGIWAKKNPAEAAHIVSTYWNQPVDLVEYALTVPPDRILYDQFTPKTSELQQLADLMVHFDMIASTDISSLVEDKYARNASLLEITDLNSILNSPQNKTKTGIAAVSLPH